MTEKEWTECIETHGEWIHGTKVPERVFVPADQVKPGTTAIFRRQERGKDIFWRGVVPEFRDGYAIFTLSDDKRVKDGEL